jgi:hypothetical protein
VEFREPEPVDEHADGDGDDPDEADDAETGSPVIVPPVDDVPAESAEPTGRRYPSTIGGVFYLVVLLISAAGLVVVAQGNWRVGVQMIGGSLVLAAALRLLLPAKDAGMLAVRRRAIDVGLLVTVGVLLWFLSVTIPNQPPL